MIKLYFFMTLFVTISFGQNSNIIRTMTTTDSLVDVFPLSVGNQWTYNYFWDYENYNGYSPQFRGCDSGTVTVRIIDKTSTLDSTLWKVQEIKSLYSIYNYNTSSSPSISVDTFNLIELHSGRHRLYRTDTVTVIRQSVFPLTQTFPDTALVYRYCNVNFDSIATIVTSEWPGTYIFTLKMGIGQISFDAHDNCTCLDWYSIHHTLRSSIITGVENQLDYGRLQGFHLDQNYPNPFNPSTTISFTLPSRSFVSLKVFDLIGREVATIVSEEMQAGNHSRQWNAANMPSGIYFYRLQAGLFAETKKLILLK